MQEIQVHPWVGKIPWRRKWQPTPVFLSGKSHGWKSLVGYSQWGRKESDTTEQLSFFLCFFRFPLYPFSGEFFYHKLILILSKAFSASIEMITWFLFFSLLIRGFQRTVVKNLPAKLGNTRNGGFNPWLVKIPWRRKWQPTRVFLPIKSHGQRSLAGYSPWGYRYDWATKHIEAKR